MTAPERIWAWAWQTVPMGQWGINPSLSSVEYIRADLAAIQTPDPVANTIAGERQQLIAWLENPWSNLRDDADKGAIPLWCAALMQRAAVEMRDMMVSPIDPQPDPRDEVIARLVDAADGLISYLIDKTESEIGRECRNRDLPVEVRRACAALAAAKAVQHG